MIDGSTKLVGLIGGAVAHSLSPAMHNAAFDELGLNWCYIPLPVAPNRLDEAVRGLAALGFRGANVTVPHKEAVMSHLDVVAEDAMRIGAVNTLIIHRTRAGQTTVEGHNTDVAGFIAALQNVELQIDGERAVVVGAGGGGRAAVAGLLAMGAAEIVLFNRNKDRALSVAADFAEYEGRVIPSLLCEEELVKTTSRASLLVHATPVGMWPDVDNSIWPDKAVFPRNMVVLDLVYNPDPTRLLLQAAAVGARTVSGLEMLVAQGALAFTLWTGKAAPLATLRSACRQCLGGRSSCAS